MNKMQGKILTALLLFSLGLVASCHSDNNNGGGAVAADEKFRVSLVSLDVRRVSNGDALTVDLSGVSGEEMTLQ